MNDFAQSTWEAKQVLFGPDIDLAWKIKPGLILYSRLARAEVVREKFKDKLLRKV